MNLSILIPFKNDFSEIELVVQHLLDTAGSDDLEIIVYNDGSVSGDNKPRSLELSLHHTRVINASQSFGVGYGFDRLVENAQSENIILMGSDVFPHEGWYTKVLQAIAQKPDSIGCSVCVGDKEPYIKRYGADLLFTVSNNDLPEGSKLRFREGGYTDIFQAKWMAKKEGLIYDIPCVLGAYYWTSKEYYQKIHGWDTEKENRFVGHRTYGSLEPYISLKSWLYGGGCYLDTTIEATHIFGRHNNATRWDKGSRPLDHMFWNKLFILNTMILDEAVRDKIFKHMHRELNWNTAERDIKNNLANILRIRERNRAEFVNDLSIFESKFGYKF
jgi:glycosyltransferase involved in cell wall biosynthesis